MNSIFSGMEKLSLVDFDNHMAVTLFTSGCNFRCGYCHNSLLMTKQPYIDYEEILAYLRKRKGIIDSVVVTGGEPTINSNLKSYLKDFKDLGLLVKLDTNGTNPVLLKELIDEKLIDYVAVDIKTDFEHYDALTCVKVNIENVKQTIDILINGKIDYEFRTTLINKFHNEQIIDNIGKILKGAKRIFLQKFGLRDTVLDQDLECIEKEEALIYKNILETYIDKVELRGYK